MVRNLTLWRGKINLIGQFILIGSPRTMAQRYSEHNQPYGLVRKTGGEGDVYLGEYYLLPLGGTPGICEENCPKLGGDKTILP